MTTGVNGNIATIALNVRGRNTKIKRRSCQRTFLKKARPSYTLATTNFNHISINNCIYVNIIKVIYINKQAKSKKMWKYIYHKNINLMKTEVIIPMRQNSFQNKKKKLPGILSLQNDKQICHQEEKATLNNRLLWSEYLCPSKIHIQYH